MLNLSISTIGFVAPLLAIPTDPVAITAYVVVALFVFALVTTFVDVPWFRRGYEGSADPADPEVRTQAPPPARSAPERRRSAR